MNRELDLMKSFPVYQAVPRAEVTRKVWSTRWCCKRKGPKQVKARFGVRQFATSVDAKFLQFHSWARGQKSVVSNSCVARPYHFYSVMLVLLS